MTAPGNAQLDRLHETLRVPPRLGGRYRILGELGRGGMGVVYRARDEQLERDVALKVVAPGLATEELEARLEEEARLVGRLEHPGIVPIYDLGRHDALTLFYVMKHVAGQTLEQWLPAHPSRAERLRLFLKLCEPVAFAHGQGVAHRDLKPANVMIGAFGEVLVMDWGLARPLAVADGAAVGTQGYRDPSAPADAAVPHDLVAADVFSLGGVLFYLLTSQHPSASGGPLRSRAFDRSVDPRLDAIVAHATARERYASVAELEHDILRYLDGESVQAYRERWHETAGRWIRKHQLALSLLLMYLLMRTLVALFR